MFISIPFQISLYFLELEFQITWGIFADKITTHSTLCAAQWVVISSIGKQNAKNEQWLCYHQEANRKVRLFRLWSKLTKKTEFQNKGFLRENCTVKTFFRFFKYGSKWEQYNTTIILSSLKVNLRHKQNALYRVSNKGGHELMCWYC